MSSRATNVHDSQAPLAVSTTEVSVIPPHPPFVSTAPNSNIYPPAGSIRGLPPEILMDIFQIYVEGGDTPCRLACVCVAWAKIALKTARLWCHIYITDDLTERNPDFASWSVPGFDKALFTIGRKQVCMTRIEIDQSIARARSTPLDVEIDLTDGSHRHQQEMLFHVFGQSNTSSFISRIAIVQLPNDAVAFPQPSILPSLEQFVWPEPSGAWVSLMGRVLSQSTRLSSIEVSFPVLSSLRNFDIWENIRSLTVCDSDADSFPSDAEALDTVIPRCHSLESFKVDAFEIWPSKSTPPTMCGHLVSLALYCDVQHLHLIQAAMITWLDIREPWKEEFGEPSIKNNDVEFPRLETLIAGTKDPRWIYQLKLPRLRSLSITLFRNYYLNERMIQQSNLYADFFPVNGLPTVQDAQFTANGSYGLFSTAMRSVPNANRITVVQESATDPTFWREFVQTMHPQRSQVICLKASYIQFGQGWYKVRATKLELEPYLGELVVARQKYNAPLHSLRVYWAEEKEYIQYA